MDLFPGSEQEDHGLMTKRENTELGPVCSRKLSLVFDTGLCDERAKGNFQKGVRS